MRTELHIHGVTASIWMLLLVLQSWSIHQRRTGFHRAVGRTRFLLFPFLLTGFALVEISFARSFVTRVSEIHVEYGPRFGAIDLTAFCGTAYFYFMALRSRRDVWLHAGFMIATVMFLVGPVIQRIVPLVLDALTDGRVEWSTANTVRFGMVSTLVVLWIMGRSAAGNIRPLRDAALLVAAQMLFWETLGRWSRWSDLYALLGTVDPVLIFGTALLVGISIVVAGWHRAPNRSDGMAYRIDSG